jgi:hypothetical protein
LRQKVQNSEVKSSEMQQLEQEIAQLKKMNEDVVLKSNAEKLELEKSLKQVV